jgi:hypothetical protein
MKRLPPLAVLFLSPAWLFAKEPVFVPFKIDGPVHAPEKGSFWYGPFSEGAAVFDVNGDGKPEITCGANWYEGPDWKKHEGFRPSASIHGEFVNNCGEYAVDVNQDGKLDLISAGWMRNGVYWYQNPGKNGVAWKETKIVSSDFTEGLIVEDIDGDGDSDVLINHWGPKDDQGVTWLELDRGEFRVHVAGKKGDVHGIGLGDLDGDGRKDIITPHGWYRAPAERSGEWVFHEDWRLKHEAGIRMLVIDVNGDGRNDIIYGHGHNYGLGWLEQLAEAPPGGAAAGGARKLSFQDHVIEDGLSQFHTLVLADVNQDGKLDLVTGKRLRGHAGGDPGAFDPLGVYWYDIQGGKFKKHVLSFNHLPWYATETRNPPPNSAIGTGMNINVADLNGDGLVDIVVAGKSGLYLFENRGRPPTKKM